MPLIVNFSAHESRTAGKGEPFAVLRPWKKQPLDVITNKPKKIGGKTCWVALYEDSPPRGKMIYCRFTPGSVVAGKEAWGKKFDDLGWHFVYRADYKELPTFGDGWVSSQLMPPQAVRHWLKVESVRAVRVDKLTIMDAKLLGFPLWGEQEPRRGIMTQWSSRYSRLGAAFRWEANPWAWLIQLSKAARPEG